MPVALLIVAIKTSVTVRSRTTGQQNKPPRDRCNYLSGETNPSSAAMLWLDSTKSYSFAQISLSLHRRIILAGSDVFLMESLLGAEYEGEIVAVHLGRRDFAFARGKSDRGVIR